MLEPNGYILQIVDVKGQQNILEKYKSKDLWKEKKKKRVIYSNEINFLLNMMSKDSSEP